MRTDEGGNGGIVICLGVGGLVDLGQMLGLHSDNSEADGSDTFSGVEVWLLDARRPWNLANVFGGSPESIDQEEPPAKRRQVDRSEIQSSYKPGKGGIIAFDDGDIVQDMQKERESFHTLQHMPAIDDDSDLGDSDDQDADANADLDRDNSRREAKTGEKRKSWSDGEEDDEDGNGASDRPRQRRRSGSSISSNSFRRRSSRGLLSTSIIQPDSSQSSPPNSPSAHQVTKPIPPQSDRMLRRKLRKEKRKHVAILQEYFQLGASYAEPVSSILYSLANDLGRDDNDLLWFTIVGTASMELSGRGQSGISVSERANPNDRKHKYNSHNRHTNRVLRTLRDEVRRLNPPSISDTGTGSGRYDLSIIPTTAKSPTDTSIRLSPEPRFLLIRHWSLYDSMLHSPYLASKLRLWSEPGRKRLHKLLAKMGVSLTQCKQSYTHMNMDLKRDLRKKLLECGPLYGLDDIVPKNIESNGYEGWGFVRSWGWTACLSATDVCTIVGSILEVGKNNMTSLSATNPPQHSQYQSQHSQSQQSRNGDGPVQLIDEDGTAEGERFVTRFWEAYDALSSVETLKQALPMAMHLQRAILRTGSALLDKRQIRPLRAFRIAVVKDGPDVALFTHPAALTRLALWLTEAVAEQERERRGGSLGPKGVSLVLASLHEDRGVYIVVGTGAASGGGMGRGDPLAKEERAERKKDREARKAARDVARAKQREDKARRKALRADRAGHRRRHKPIEEDSEAGSQSESSSEEEQESSESESGSESESEDEDEGEDERREKKDRLGAVGRNRFGNAFQEVVEETNAKYRIDSFEHCVVEVKKDHLAGFLESLSQKAVVG